MPRLVPRSTCTTTKPTSTHLRMASTRPPTSSRSEPLLRTLTTMPGLEDLYREIILDHYRNPRNRGELPTPPAHRTEGFNPLCGDEIVLFLDVEDGRIADVRI